MKRGDMGEGIRGRAFYPNKETEENNEDCTYDYAKHVGKSVQLACAEAAHG